MPRDTDKRLLDIKEDLDEKKIAKNKIEGQLEVVEQEIKELSSCKTIKTAEKKCNDQKKLIEERRNEFDEDVIQLEEDYYNVSN